MYSLNFNKEKSKT